MSEISVIIPVYNVEKYLRSCLDSLLNQTFKDLEFICIDDGSTDNSAHILYEYAQKDPRFTIMQQKNQGQGVARNNGIQVAKGKYIAFVDPDDWVESNMFEILVKKIRESNAEIIQFNYKEHNEYTKNSKNYNIIKSLSSVMTYDENGNAYYTWQDIKNKILYFELHAWTRIYSKEFINKYKIKFTNTKILEDHLFINKAILNSKRIYLLDYYPYHYRRRKNSTVNIISDINLQIFENFADIKNYLIKQNLYNELEECFKEYVTLLITRHYHNIPILKRAKYRKESLKYISQEAYKNILKIATNNNSYLENIFSIKNKKKWGENFKIITIFWREYGIKFNKNEKLKPIEYLFSIRNNKDRKIIRIFGLKIKFINKKKEFENLKIEMTKLQSKLLETQKTLNSIHVNIKAQHLHKKTFGEYKNININKDAVLICGGHSIKYFNPILNNAVYIAVNNSCNYDKVKFDYIFLQELHLDSNKNKIVNNYDYEKCTKFYGIIPEKRLTQVYPNVKLIPQSDIIHSNIKRYYLDDRHAHAFAYDLTTEALGDFSGTAFSAIQFILWTNPERIFIVSADCRATGNAFNKQEIPFDYSYQYRYWVRLKQFADDVYPKTEIISVNPIGLKGLFKDVYTKYYVKAHPELFEDLSDIEFLEDIIVNGEVCHV